MATAMMRQVFSARIHERRQAMPTLKQILMTAVLTGKDVLIKLQEHLEDEARSLLVNLSSELSTEDVDYLVGRFKEMPPVEDIIAPITLERDRYVGHPEGFSLPCELAETLGMVERALIPKLKAGGKYQIRIAEEE